MFREALLTPLFVHFLLLFFALALPGCGGGGGGTGAIAGSGAGATGGVAFGRTASGGVVTVPATADSNTSLAGIQTTVTVMGLTPHTVYSLYRQPFSPKRFASGAPVATATTNANGTANFENITIENGDVLSVQDAGNSEQPITVTVSITGEQNHNPTVSAGQAQSVHTNTLVTLTATGSDQDLDTLTYLWSQTSGAQVTLAGTNTATATFTPTVAGTYVFSVAVSDGRGGSAASTVTITVSVPPVQNQPPVVSTQPARSVVADTAINLTATASDVDGDSLSYTWVQLSGTTLQLAGATTASLTFTPSQTGTYLLQLTVSDGRGGSASAEVTVTVTPASQPPSISTSNVAILVPARQKSLELQVQAAYNQTAGKVFWKFSWAGNKGHTHDYYTFTNGAWKRDGDQFRNLTGFQANSESRVSFLVNDPTDAKAVRNFGKYGCFMTCHDSSQNMPDFASGGVSGEPQMKLPSAQIYSSSRLDLWHWRGHRSNPIGFSDDQWVDASGRKADSGTGIYSTNNLVSGHPEYVFKPTTTSGGRYATPRDSYFLNSPDYYLTKSLASHPQQMLYTTATTAGYVPAEGDTVPRRRLGTPSGSAADILSVVGSQVSTYDAQAGRWNVFLQRALATGHTTDDVDLAVGNLYEVCFAIHSDHSGNRDHYVSLPVKVGLSASGADLAAVSVSGGAEVVPDFASTGTYPVTTLTLFLPGLTSWEYLTGTRTNPFEVGNPHSGADSVNEANTGDAAVGCQQCHAKGGSRDLTTGVLAARRGGVFDHTPISFSRSVVPALEARCLPCHKTGGTASTFSLGATTVVTDTAYLTIRSTVSRFINYAQPTASAMLTIPAKNSDGNHAASGSLTGFSGSTDYNKMLYWILFNSPKN